MKKNEFDIFLSYKTENANDVRKIAECLIANGLRIWFAEYKIHSDIYDNNDILQQTIDNGIENSRYALVFTNDRWADSEYCSREMEGLLKHFQYHDEELIRNRKHHEIAEIFIPKEKTPHENWPVLKNVPSLLFENDLEKVIEFINDRHWFVESLRVDIAPGIEITSGEKKSLPYGVSLDTSQFKECPETIFVHDARKEFGGEKYFFRKEIPSGRIGLLININPYESALGPLSIAKQGNAADRLVYKAYRYYAKKWLDSHDKTDRGIHLVFWNNRSHLGITSINKEEKEGKRFWERRYFIALQNKKENQIGEMDISFGLYLPDNDEEAFHKFILHTRLFEHVINSIEYHPGPAAVSSEFFSLIIVKLLLACSFAIGLVHVMLKVPQTIPVSILAVLCGLFSMDFLFSIFNKKTRKETSHYGLTIGQRFRPWRSMGRFIDRIWNLLVGSIIHVSLISFAGIFNVVSIIAILFLFVMCPPAFLKSYITWMLIGAGVYLAGFINQRIIMKED
ncbi:MAG: toll/interleukin-1 receptor domain-containing protein [Candidatus Aminicenantes bacterium]|nr:toll/interleukin-1 receptor domain-containing protein [Candidatus Aminicenantes bacterium]